MAKTDLLKEIEELGGVAVKDATVEVLEFQLKALKLDALKTSTDQEITDLKTEIETLKGSNDSLTEKLELAEAKNVQEKRKSDFPIYKVKKVTYQFKVPAFVFKGEKYKSDEAVENSELMDSLIESKFAQLIKL
jgi:hypothetical protein